MLLIIGRRAGVFVRNTLRPSVLGLTECHSTQRAKAAIDGSRNGSTGSAIMAQLLAAANNRIIREPTERMEQGKLGLLDVPVFVDRADDVANNRTQPASILLLRTHRTCPLLRLILR